MQTGRKSVGVSTPTDCPRLPVSISGVSRPSETIAPSFKTLYMKGWNNSRTLPAHNCDNFLRSGDYIWTILWFENESFAPAKRFQTFLLPTIFRIRVITTGALGKSLKSYVDSRYRSYTYREASSGPSSERKDPSKGSSYQTDKFTSTLGKFFFSFCCVGGGRKRILKTGERRLVGLSCSCWFSVLASEAIYGIYLALNAIQSPMAMVRIV